MADQVVANWTDFMYELRGPMQELFPTEFILMDQIDRTTKESGPNQNREIFSGNWVRVPLLPVPHQGGGFLTETGTWNVPVVQVTDQAQIRMARYLMPVSVSPDLLQASLNNAAAQAMATLVKTARIGMARDENTALLGAGDGLIAAVASGTSPGLTMTFGSTAAPANADELYWGRVGDILTRASGANPGGGLRRKITQSVDNGDGTVTVTFDTAQQATDGQSGPITFSGNEGFYLPGSYGNACQGLIQALGPTPNTFEGIDRSTGKDYWKGTDGRGGVVTATALTTAMLDGAVRRLWPAGVKKPSFWLGDPAVIDLYQQGLYTLSRWAGQSGTLGTGFEGVSYQGTILVDEHQHQRGAITGLDKDSIQMYGYHPGPDFLDDDGAQFRRFNRSLPKEFDLVDFYQFGFMRIQTHVYLRNLTRAA